MEALALLVFWPVSLALWLVTAVWIYRAVQKRQARSRLDNDGVSAA